MPFATYQNFVEDAERLLATSFQVARRGPRRREQRQAQTTTTSVKDAQMVDVGNQWGAPFLSNGSWSSFIDVPTGVTMANPGDSMRFTFAEVLSTKVPEIFNPAMGGEPGQPLSNGPGLVFGGTCTVTAT